MKIRAFWLVFEGDGAEVCSLRGFKAGCAMDVPVVIAIRDCPPPIPGPRNFLRSGGEPCFSNDY